MSAVLIVGLVVIFAVIRFGRSLFGRQQFQRRRLWVRLVLSVVVGAVIIVPAVAQVDILAGELVGVGLGIALAWLARRLTVIERAPGATFYRPNPYVSLGVLALWIGRFAFRLVTTLPTLATTAGGGAHPSQLVSDPLTGGAYLLLITYFACYSALLLHLS